MDWARAVEINREALTRIVAGLVAFLAAQGTAARLPLPVYRFLLRVLNPAESAVRRLIVIAARGLEVPLPQARPMPQGLVIKSKGGARASFPLCDPRKSFRDDEDCGRRPTGPRIRMIGDQSPREMFLARFATPRDGRCSTLETQHVATRVALLKRALDHLPREARRMARWLQRRAASDAPAIKVPLRPGGPPGYSRRSRDEIDDVLMECHILAWQALRPNTS